MKPAVIEKPSTEMLFFWDKECQQKKRNTHTQKKKKRWSLQLSLKVSRKARNQIFPSFASSQLCDADLSSVLLPPSPERSVLKKLIRLPAAVLISVQLPQPPALLTEHQIKKVSQLYICGLRGETFPPLQKASTSVFPAPNNPLRRRTSPRRSANEPGSLKKQSPLQWFTPSAICEHPSSSVCHAHSLRLYRTPEKKDRYVSGYG